MTYLRDVEEKGGINLHLFIVLMRHVKHHSLQHYRIGLERRTSLKMASLKRPLRFLLVFVVAFLVIQGYFIYHEQINHNTQVWLPYD